ncbi:MAG: hypothetical protein PVJ68_18535 [Candidatus Thiodiazotropha sp.]
MLRLNFLMLFVFILSGCASDSMHRYDQNAIKKSGTIQAKEEIENWEELESDTLDMPVAGFFVQVQLGSPSKEGNDFRYIVKVRDGEALPVISKFSGFKVGECVTVFFSQTMPPRIAHGGVCQ